MRNKNQAIFKFNGGNGALLCSKCSVIIKTGKDFTELEHQAMKGEAKLQPQYCEEHGGESQFNYKIIRLEDGLKKQGNRILWVEWDVDGTFHQSFDKIAIGRSLLLDPILYHYEWMTTPVIEILESQDKYVKFRTRNSTYEIYINI